MRSHPIRSTFAFAAALTLLASGLATAAVAPQIAARHTLGEINHGTILTEQVHPFAEHNHGRKTVWDGLKLGPDAWQGRCNASGTATHIHCDDRLGGVHRGHYEVTETAKTGPAPSPPYCAEELPSPTLLDGHGICPHFGGNELLRVLDHVPPASVVAGDPVELTVTASAPCESPCLWEQARLVYFDGDWIAVAPTQTTALGYRFEVPGDSVRYPELRYYFEVTRCMQSAGPNPSCPEPPVGPGPDPAPQLTLPASGRFSQRVAVVVRFRLTYPDGAPAADVPVRWHPQPDADGEFEVSTSRTDSQGHAAISLDPIDPEVVKRARDDGYMNLHIASIVGWPMDTVEEPTEALVLQKRLGTVVDLGGPVLGAAPSIQDRSFELERAVVQFLPPPSATGWTCDTSGFFIFLSSTCWKTVADGEQELVVADNVGGDRRWHTTFTYSRSESTTSTYGIGSADGLQWAESDGEVGTQRSNPSSWPFYGEPNTNEAVVIKWQFKEYVIRDCDLFGCLEHREKLPFEWSGFIEDREWLGVHGSARAPGGPDCTIPPAEGPVTIENAEGLWQSYRVSFGSGNQLGLNYKMHYRQGYSSTTSTSYIWQAGSPPSNEPHMYLFVPDAWRRDNQGVRRQFCPPHAPGETFTDTSAEVKLNPFPPDPLGD